MLFGSSLVVNGGQYIPKIKPKMGPVLPCGCSRFLGYSDEVRGGWWHAVILILLLYAAVLWRTRL